MGTGRRERGFSLLEILVVVAVFAALAAFTVPSLARWQGDQRVKAQARLVASALGAARREAMRTGNNQIAFFASDILGNPLQDPNGVPVPILVLDDGRTGSPQQNCQPDLGEPFQAFGLEDGVGFGATDATSAPATDTGGGAFAGGSSFTDPNGNPASWVQFRPDGTPVAVSSACVTGAIGSGGGGVYLTNGYRDVAVVLTPLGVPQVHTWDPAGGQWNP